MTKPGPKPLLHLEDYIPPTPADADWLEDALLDAGTSPMRAARIARRLDRLGRTGSDGLTSVDRTNYRLELAKIAPPPWRRARVGLRGEAKGAYNAPTIAGALIGAGAEWLGLAA